MERSKTDKNAKKTSGESAVRVKRPCREDKVEKKEGEEPEKRTDKVTFVRNASAPLDGGVEVTALHDQVPTEKKKSWTRLPSRTASDDAASRAAEAAPSATTGPASELELNSVHRVGDEMLRARAALTRAEGAEDDALELNGFAQRRLDSSPEERRRLEREAARGVDFEPEEVLFRDLQGLDVSESEFRELEGRRQKGRPPGFPRQVVPMPRMEDFHRPYAGEDVAVEDDEHDEEKLFRLLDRARKERRMRWRQGRRDASDSSRTSSSREFIKKLDDWGLR